MKAAVINRVGNLSLAEVPVPEPKTDEVRIAVELGGICGSDNSMYHGKLEAPLPIIPGHEAVGVIDAVGDGVTSLSEGQRVTIHPNYFCGECELCRKDLTNICDSKVRLGVDIDGVFADYVVVPANSVFPVPEELPNEAAVFAEPLAVGLHGIKQVDIKDTDRVLVFGAGVMGQLVLQLVLDYSKRITSCDLVETRLELAQRMGAGQVYSNMDQLHSLQGSFDVIFETTGAPQALSRCVELAAPGATIVTLGLPAQEHPVSSVLIVRKQLTIKGSIIYTTEIPESLELLNRGHLNTEALISDVIDLEQLQYALENFSDPSRMKVLVRIS